MATIDWRGRQVLQRMAAAAQLGVDKTMAECVRDAKHSHPWVNDSGFLEGSIMITGAASQRGLKVSGSWGATANYALFLEIGTSRIGATAFVRELEGAGFMWSIPLPKPDPGVTVTQPFTIAPPGRLHFADGTTNAGWITLHQPSKGTGPLLAPRPFLRPAADREYRKLSARIGAAYRGESMP